MAAASTSHLLLTRIDHEAKVLNVMRNLLEDGQLTDVTLACEGQLIHAHKLILSSVSNYFQTIFQNPMLKSQSNPVIVVKDMKMVDLKAIIEFVYSGEVRICGDQLESLVRSAETLDISGLNKIDPNPVNHVSSKTSTENDLNSPNENGSEVQSNGNLSGKSNSHRFQDNSTLQRKTSNATEKSSASLPKKTTSEISTSTRGTRSSDRRAPLVSSEGKSKAPLGNVRRKTQENISESKDDQSAKLDDSSRREMRYNFRVKLKEGEESSEKIKRSDIQNKSCNDVTDQKIPKDRRSSSICEPIANVENSNVKTSSDQTVNENIGDCLKELVVGQQLTNISNKTPEFKKPLEPVRRNCKLMKLFDEASGSSKEEVSDPSHPPDATDEEMGTYMRQFVYEKSNLKMNLRRDDDTQSVSSVTTRSRKSKLSEGCEKQNTETTSTNQSIAATKTKRNIDSEPTKKSLNLRKKKVVKPTTNRTTSITRTSARPVKSGDSRWKARTAKLKAAVATTRLSAKSRANRVDWKAWFESQQKINQFSFDRRKKETKDDKTKSDNSSENNKPRPTDSPRSNLSSRTNDSPLCYKDLEPKKQTLQQQIQTQNGLSLQSASTNTIPNSELDDLGNNLKSKRRQTDQTQDELNKRDSTLTTPARNLRPKRVKASLDSSDNQLGSATSNTSTISVASSTLSLSTPNSTMSLQPGDTNV